MKILRSNRLGDRRRKPTAADVIRSELKKAYDLYPDYLFPASVTTALADAGFTIVSDDDMERELHLAYEAGVMAAEL